MTEEITVEKDKVVSLKYILKDDDGNILDSFTEDKPYLYLHGNAQLLPVIEELLEGQLVGFSTNLVIGADDAYGIYQDELVVEVDKQQFATDNELKTGMKYATKGPDGSDVVVSIIEIKDDSVVLDGNHPLAGLDLVLDIEVLAIRNATKEELSNKMPLVAKEELH